MWQVWWPGSILGLQNHDLPFDLGKLHGLQLGGWAFLGLGYVVEDVYTTPPPFIATIYYIDHLEGVENHKIIKGTYERSNHVTNVTTEPSSPDVAHPPRIAEQTRAPPGGTACLGYADQNCGQPQPWWLRYTVFWKWVEKIRSCMFQQKQNWLRRCIKILEPFFRYWLFYIWILYIVSSEWNLLGLITAVTKCNQSS